MALRLTIETVANLPVGFERSASVAGHRNFVIGRDGGADWNLPDPMRQISSRHCEILDEGGEFVLRDHSTNGTFLNGAEHRLEGPHRLVDGDRIEIGPYVIAVEVVEGLPADAAVPRGLPARPVPRGGDPATAGVATLAGASAPSEPYASPAHRAPMTVIRPAPRSAPSPLVRAADPLPSSPQETDVSTRPDSDEIAVLRSAARGLGLPAEALESRDANALVEEMGALIRLAVDELMALLQETAQARCAIRSSDGAGLALRDGNPLKLAPSADIALRHLFGSEGPGYLGALPALQTGFTEVRSHHRRLLAGLLGALQQVSQDLDPGVIEARVPPGGLTSASRATRLWSQYVATWRRYSATEPGRLSPALLRELGEAYDRGA